MASNNNVNINITATGGPAAVAAVNLVTTATTAAGRTADQQLARQERARELLAQRAEQQRARAAAHAAADAAADAEEERRLARAAQRATNRSRQAATGIATIGTSSINSGRAVLSLSQGFEDAQYGVRGLLNNIPGLVMALGGGAGITGAISIAAVSLNILWEHFGKVEKKAKESGDTISKYFEEVTQVWKDIEQLGDDDRKAKKKDDDLSHEKDLAGIKFANSGALFGNKLEEIRAVGEAENEIARKKLEIMTLESQLALATGKTALELSKARLEASNDIYASELRISELHREAEVNAAKIKIGSAESTATAAKNRANNDNDLVREKANEVAGYRSEADTIRASLIAREEERKAILAKIEALNDEQKNILKNNSFGGIKRNLEINTLELPRLQNSLAKNEDGRPELEQEYASKQAQADAAAKTLESASSDLADSSKAQQASSEALRDAIVELRQLRRTQGGNVNIENERRITDAKTVIEGTGKTVTDAATTAINDIKENAANQGRGTNPAESEAVGRLQGLVGDKVSDAEQGQTLASILQGLANSLTAKDQALAVNVEALIAVAKSQLAQVQEQRVRIAALESQASQKR